MVEALQANTNTFTSHDTSLLDDFGYGASANFLIIYTDGTIYDATAHYSGAVAPGFDF